MSVAFSLCLIVLFTLAAVGAPIAHSMIVAAVVYLAVAGQDLGLAAEQMIQGIYDSFIILAVPLFIVAANIMNEGAITDRLLDFCKAAPDRLIGLPMLPETPDAARAELERLIARGGVRQVNLMIANIDPKLDDPALLAALPSRAFYVGALGSKRTQEKRRSRLLEAGIAPDALARLHGPIGLPLGGRSPEEIAVAILAQIVETRNRPRSS